MMGHDTALLCFQCEVVPHDDFISHEIMSYDVANL